MRCSLRNLQRSHLSLNETIDPKSNKKEENTMLTSLACFGIYATVTVGTIWFFSKL